MSFQDRHSDEYDPEPDYERPTRAEAAAEAAEDRKAQRYGGLGTGTSSPPALKDCTNTQLADRVRRAADRVVGSRPDLAALLEEAAERLDGGPF